MAGCQVQVPVQDQCQDILVVSSLVMAGLGIAANQVQPQAAEPSFIQAGRQFAGVVLQRIKRLAFINDLNGNCVGCGI
jgi:hypothetical protein